MNDPVVPGSCALITIDMQQKLVAAMHQAQTVLNRVALLNRAAQILHLEQIATEQYPKGLGNTVPEIAATFASGTRIIEKLSFSVFGEERFRTAIAERKFKSLIFCGIESHVCVLQSVFDALNRGYEVWLAGDAVSSRNPLDVKFTLDAALQAGAKVLSSEAIVMLLLRTAQAAEFKEISRLIR